MWDSHGGNLAPGKAQLLSSLCMGTAVMEPGQERPTGEKNALGEHGESRPCSVREKWEGETPSSMCWRLPDPTNSTKNEGYCKKTHALAPDVFPTEERSGKTWKKKGARALGRAVFIRASIAILPN